MAIPRTESEVDQFVEKAFSPWRDALITNARGIPKALFANAVTAFRAAPEWAGILRYDAFAQKTVLIGKTPWMASEVNRNWETADDLLATNWLQHEGVHVSPETVNLAIETAARDFTFHPVLEYLNGLQWDGVSRLALWTTDGLGVTASEFVYAASSKFLISAVARVMRPGCKADCALILEGPQGLMKSTALRTMFQPWFADEMAEVGSKDAAMQLAGKWCIEMSELDAMKRADVAKMKSFLSRNEDHFRPPYGRRTIDQKRQCVIAGTVNDNEYLRDETGNRRIWPLLCSRIDIDWLQENRDQIWAEARDEFFNGKTWWLDSQHLIDSSRIEQDARRILDPWQEKIETWLRYREDVSPAEILDELFDKKPGDQTQLDQNRVATCLKAIGWQRTIMRTENGPRRRYKRQL